MMLNRACDAEMTALDQVAGTVSRARATMPHGIVTLSQGIRTMRDTLSGTSLEVVGGLYQLTSRVQRAAPRDFVHVRTLPGPSGIGASEALLDGGPKLAASADGCMSMTFSGAGKGGIDIHATAAATDRRRVKPK